MADLFISYARADQARVDALAAVLQGAGWSVWWDRRIQAGSSFDKAIEQALDDAKVVIVAWSRNSVHSDWVRAEAAYALEKSKLVPVRLDDAVSPLRFIHVQTVDLSGWDGQAGHEAARQLLAELAEIVGAPSAPAVRVPVGAAPATEQAAGAAAAPRAPARSRTVALLAALLIGLCAAAFAIYKMTAAEKPAAKVEAALPSASQQSPPAAAAAVAPAAPIGEEAAEIAFWNSVKDASKPEPFREYLVKFPNGTFAGLARLKIKELTPPAQRPASQAPAAAVPAKPEQPTATEDAFHKALEALGRKDYAEAMTWYRKAADVGYAPAQNNLGAMYRNGWGVPADPHEAMSWFRKAADQGYATAEVNLGGLYQNGVGVERDFAEAARWYRKAADLGHSGAQVNLGMLYQNGLGVAKDYAEAMRWYRKSADQDNAAAEIDIGVLYRNGWGVAQDYAEAMRWFRKAADRGQSGAQLAIGLLYRNGLGVPKDDAKARYWYGLSATQGNEQARRLLAELGEK